MEEKEYSEQLANHITETVSELAAEQAAQDHEHDIEQAMEEGRTVKCPYTPLNEYIIVRMHNPEKKTLAGIYLPDLKKESGVAKGIVVAINSGRWVMDGSKKVPGSSGVEVGELVYFFKQNAFEIPHTGYFLIPEQILLCKQTDLQLKNPVTADA